MRNIVMWSIPRSRSTAFERSVMQRGDLDVWHEALSAPYLKQHALVGGDVLAETSVGVCNDGDIPSYNHVLTSLSPKVGAKRVFSKELVCFFDEERISDEWLRDFHHVFLVRFPSDALHSLWRVSNHGPTTYYNPDEVDFVKLARVYDRVRNVCGPDATMVLDADDDLIDDTENALRRFCSQTGLEFDPAMLEWEAKPVGKWDTWKGWHDDAVNSSAFSVRSHQPKQLPQDIHEDIERRSAYQRPFYAAFQLQASLERFAHSDDPALCWQQIDGAKAQLLIPAYAQLSACELIEYSSATFLAAAEIVFYDTDSLARASAVKLEEISRTLDKLVVIRANGSVGTSMALARGLTSRIAVPVHYLPSFTQTLPLDFPQPWGGWCRDTLDHIYAKAQKSGEERSLAWNRQTRGSVDFLPFSSAYGMLLSLPPNLEILLDGENTWTAAEFVSDVESLAASLKAQCEPTDGEHSWVVIFANRSAHTVLAMGACLHAGRPFLEVPTWYRQDHIQMIFDQIAPSAIFTDETSADKLSNGAPQILICQVLKCSAAAPQQDLEEGPSTHKPAFVRSRELAHGVLTSGTTSLAKLVEIPNAQVNDSITSFAKYIKTGDRVGLNAWLSCYIFYPPLLGATSVVVPDDVIINPKSLLRFVERERLTQLMVTPSLLEGLVSLGEELTSAFAGIHTLWISGEALPKHLWKEAAQVLPGTRLLNLLGINETGDVGISHNANGWFDLLPGIEVYVLDENGQIVPDNVIGELHIASHGLSNGYFLDPDNTAKFFVPNPYANSGPKEPSTLYRSGDRVRRNKNGQLSFDGRGSAHMKVRGYKVDPSRIEAVLTSHRSIQSAVVQTRGSGVEIQIAAYLVISKESNLTAHDVRELCLENLPAYAVPAVFYQLDELPIAGSKKRQTSELGKSIHGKILSDKSFGLTREEAQIADAFRQVLGHDLPSFGPGDNFFDFGGSLQLLVLRNEIEHQTGVFVSIEEVYRNPTVRGLSELVTRIGNGEAPHDGHKTVNISDEAAAYELPREKGSSSANRKHTTVLLTGATGFVGRQILKALLEDTRVSQVACLARGENDLSASQRLKDVILSHLRPSPKKWGRWQSKLTILAGDVSGDNLSIGPETYEHLVRHVNKVIHCAAEVNWVKPYESLKAANVTGTFNVLKLCAAADAELLFLSTVPANQAPSGYHETKLVAEALCDRFSNELGLHAQVIRCGDVAPPVTVTGQLDYNADDYIVLLLQACFELGRWPSDVAWNVNLAPVDYAAIAMVSNVLSHETMTDRYSVLVNPADTAWVDICEWIQHELPAGAFEETSFDDFRSLIEDGTQSNILQRALLVLQGSLHDLERGPELKGLSVLGGFSPPVIDAGYVLRLAMALSKSIRPENIRLTS